MDVLNIGELNRWVLLLLMMISIYWIFKAVTLKGIEISTAKVKLENSKLDSKLKELEIDTKELIKKRL